jgi:hypothetical protein
MLRNVMFIYKMFATVVGKVGQSVKVPKKRHHVHCVTVGGRIRQIGSVWLTIRHGDRLL